ncbi:MAG: hypothetical protein K2W95_30385 [Candidatus Obscuribacterales bacterium]|nr:hypothetical protein [Candidatus Obscuribacterales bacterium]
MKNRIGIIWLVVLTVYMAYTTTDTYNVLKTVASNQRFTLLYMEKSTEVLTRMNASKADVSQK